ncbi:metabolite traffic protein EboE [Paralimibaculum aggregatum]|uniref:Metabolite traffic protein EboE n=1 Tax=Paralimibaculum aggregatum TaxID=3036245 RepID=A0ABQ6LLR1_9RHOB|nr:metabolite traffic protein EboE [Limibaculum sp. NKW23]GMG84136.1 metabolite traffic protein EboE [Limibaculum sp. NKW23]
MRLPDGPGGPLGELTYCLNIHPTESWAELRAALAGPTRNIARALAGEAPFTAGLRISGRALSELADPAARAELNALLAEGGLRPSTVNGFPYGPFHGTRVKEDVYQPDWRGDTRLAYTNALAELMAELAAEGETVSLSTVPGTFRPLGAGAEAEMAGRMLAAAAHCARLAGETGRVVALAIEPEPCCFLETIEETVAFFEEHLFARAGLARFAALSGLGPAEAEPALRRHLGLCYDVCHAAVEFEDAAGSIAALRAAGIAIPKLQLSAALRIPSVDAASRAALAAFDEPTYLHQVISRRGNGPLRRETDLAPALARGAEADGEEWRVHFHVPVFLADLGAFASTQDFLAEILALHRQAPISPHLEVETYTWDVLPEPLRAGGLEAAVARELRWVTERLTA